MKPLTSSQIIEVLKANRKWFDKQDLANRVHAKYRTLHDTVGRVARAMAREGIIEVDYKPVPRVRAIACYRFKSKKA